MLVAVGSTRAPKVDAVRRVLAALAGRDPELGGAELAAREVEHGAPAMPLAVADLLRGAAERARLALAAVRAEGLELSEAVDALMKRRDVRSREGAWGVFTGGLMDRTRSFELALLNAWAPFYNRGAYA